ncbi:MAG: hypothetical protein KGZ41_04320 [Dethiobacter sp.]|nr:hypothetical protein [Dethiobacter sp.]
MLKWLLKNEKGLSLVELVISLSFLSVILGIGYSYFYFATNTFRVGQNQSNLQQNIRLATNYITRELRTAHLVEVKGNNFTIPATDPHYGYIFIDAGNGRITHLKKGTTQKVDILSGLTDNVSFNINFRPKAADPKTLVYTISGTYQGTTNSSTSELFLENVTRVTTTDGATTETGGAIIRYAKPGPPAPTIKNVTLTPSEITFGNSATIVVNVETAFVNNGSLVTAKFFYNDPAVPPLEASASIRSDVATLFLSPAEPLPVGAYKIEVWVTNTTYPHTKAFIVNPVPTP